MNQPCERCPCPAQCIRRPSFCAWAAEDPPDPVRMRHICDRSAMGEAPAYPSLATMATNVVKAAGRVIKAAAKGEEIRVPREEFARRLAICRACDQFDAQQQRCRLCGCYTAKKLGLATEACPLTEPKWGKWTPPALEP